MLIQERQRRDRERGRETRQKRENNPQKLLHIMQSDGNLSYSTVITDLPAYAGRLSVGSAPGIPNESHPKNVS